MKHGQASDKLTVVGFALRFPARLSGDSLPSRKLVLPWGESTAIDGPVVLDEASVAAFNAVQKKHGWDRVALDYEHNTLPGTPAYKECREPRDVAAFGVPMLVPREGIYLNAMEWTPGGVKSVPNFCDISPALAFAPGTRRVVGLHSAALTRAGAIEGIHAFSVTLPEAETQSGVTMERTVLLALFGLADSATDDELLAAAKTFGATLKELIANDVCGMCAQIKDGVQVIKDLNVPDVKAKIVAFSAINTAAKEGIEGVAQRLAKVEEKITAFSADRANAERASVIEKAKHEGKVLPFSAEALKTVPIETLRDVAACTPVTVPMDQRTVNVEPFSAASGREVAEAGQAEKIAGMFGRKVADLAKAGLSIALVCGLAFSAVAAPLTQSVNTPTRAGKGLAVLQASNVVYGGAIAAIATATGKIVPATDTAGLMVVGRVDETSDNGGVNASLYSATRQVSVSRGVFRWDNDGNITAANVGGMAYVLDDHTVTTAAVAANDIPAGIILDVDALGVWVDTTSLVRILTGSVNTLAVVGAASVGTTFDAGGAATFGSTLGVTGAVTAGAGVSVAGALVCTNPVTIHGLPTSTNGLTSGRVWSNSGALSVMP